MTMHGTLGRDMEADGDALFFADAPIATRAAAAFDEPRSAYGANRRPNWASIAAIVAVHVAAFYALVTFDVIQIAPPKKALVVDLIAEPPAPPAEKPEPQPVVVERVQPAVIAPPQIVQTLAPPPSPIMVTIAPPPPKPVAAPASPAGPVVEDLYERLLEGQPPRVPYEARRKKQGGTVLLRLVIGSDGRVDQISIARTSGFESLDQAALQAVRRWVWKPLIRDGVAVALPATLPITFNITN